MNLRSPITRSVDGRIILSKALNLKTSSEIKSSDRNVQALKSARLNAEQFAKTRLSSLRSDGGAVKDPSPELANAYNLITSGPSPAKVTRLRHSQESTP